MSAITQVCAVQAGSVLFDTARTLEKFSDLLSDAVANFSSGGPRLCVFPEAFIGGYPKGNHFGAPIGSRSDEGRALFQRYFQSAIAVPGPETARMAKLVKGANCDLIVGVIERDASTLYCTALCFSASGQLLGKRRKLMPTAAERVIWGAGDGSTLDAFDTQSGKLSAVICWENYMPMLRLSQYAQGTQIYCAPTVDDRPQWTSTMTMIALEGRCFVVGASQFLTRADVPDGFETIQGEGADTVLINGGSVIVSPLGEVLAGPVFGREAMICAGVDLSMLAAARMDFDVVGHYARPDIFSLTIDREAKRPVR
ncbi:MAG: carbon-nitrogen hydrolase family protein [Pseudomonadota bacterium]